RLSARGRRYSKTEIFGDPVRVAFVEVVDAGRADGATRRGVDCKWRLIMRRIVPAGSVHHLSTHERNHRTFLSRDRGPRRLRPGCRALSIPRNAAVWCRGGGRGRRGVSGSFCRVTRATARRLFRQLSLDGQGNRPWKMDGRHRRRGGRAARDYRGSRAWSRAAEWRTVSTRTV